MEHSSTNSCIPRVLILSSFFLISQSVYPFVTDNQKLIYNQCTNQTSPNPSFSPLLSRLFQEFISRSSKSSFFETIVADDETAISGTFQCRNDLSPDDCRSCVSKFPALSEDLCGKNTPARIQLSGCYAHYQEDGDESTESASDHLLHRACSKKKVKKHRFEEMKYEAFAALESGVMSGHGFCEMTYESIHVLAQCAGSLGACDCVECVNNAVQIAEEECRFSVSGEVYLDSCSISYDYKEHGYGGYSFGGGGSKTPKLLAIVVGGFIAASVGLALFYFMWSRGKKRDGW